MVKKSWIYLGTELKKLREDTLKLSQVEFSKMFEISKSLVCKVESGERRYSQEIMDLIFSKFSINRYNQLKFLVLSEQSFNLINKEEDCFNVIKLIVELKNKGLYSIAKELIQKSIDTFDDSVDFYVLLSTVYLIEHKYKESEENILLALDLYKAGVKSISKAVDIYHNYGNIFFNMAYSLEVEKMHLVADMVKESNDNAFILSNSKYKKLSDKILNLYLKAEEMFIKSHQADNKDEKTIFQIAKVYFNIFNLDIKNNTSYISKSYDYINKYLDLDVIKTNLNYRIEITALLSILLLYKDMNDTSIILSNTLSGFKPKDPLVYYVRALIYSYIGNNNEELLRKSIENIKASLEISNYDEDMILQIISDLHFENVRQSEFTKNSFIDLLFNKVKV